MKRELLHKYFRGEASIDEENIIMAWIESNEDNFSFFMKERNSYDILLLTTPSSSNEKTKRFKMPSIFWNVAASISVFLVGSLVYFYIQSFQSYADLNVIKVPKGQYVELLLGDSTKVWLNSNSVFKYPSDFSDDKRIVYLDGEGYFEVKKNFKKQFVVKTDLGDVAVTGTTFNLISKVNTSVFETGLIEGGVSIYKDDILISKLLPNQKISLENDRYIVSNLVKTDQYLWREGLLAFKNEKITTILNRFAESYDVEIQISPNVRFNHTYTGKFRQTDGLDYSLRLLQKSTPFKYDYNAETNILYIE